MDPAIIASRLPRAHRAVLIAHIDAIAVTGKPLTPHTRYAQVAMSLVVSGLIEVAWNGCTVLTEEGRGVLAALLGLFADSCMLPLELEHRVVGRTMRADRFFGTSDGA